MRIIVTYESMFGNTRQIAEAMAGELEGENEVTVVPAASAGTLDEPADLVIVGAPTHAHGLPRPSTRRGVPDYVNRSKGTLQAEPEAQGPGVRELLAGLADGTSVAAAFDTRLKLPPILVGRPSRAIARSLRRHGHPVVGTESFYVDKENHLLAGELDRSRAWARRVAASAATRSPRPAERP
jgi:hypothetical protein